MYLIIRQRMAYTFTFHTVKKNCSKNNQFDQEKKINTIIPIIITKKQIHFGD